MEQYGFRLLNDDELKSLNIKHSKGSFKTLFNTMKQEVSIIQNLILEQQLKCQVKKWKFHS